MNKKITFIIISTLIGFIYIPVISFIDFQKYGYISTLPPTIVNFAPLILFSFIFSILYKWKDKKKIIKYFFISILVSFITFLFVLTFLLYPGIEGY
jgi:cytochrome bd-type quinol oxidase subunit 2